MTLDTDTPDRHDATDDIVLYRRTGNRAARDRFVQRHIGLAHSMAQRYAGRGVPLEDLRQIAFVGLLRATERFDPARGVSFSSFAVPTILGELRRHFRDHCWTVSVPRRLKELRARVDETVVALEQRTGASASVEDVAAALGEDVDMVLFALDGLRSCYRPEPLDDTALRAVTEDVADHAEESVLVVDLLADLPDRERRIIFFRYWLDLTQQEIAERLGISQMHVSRLLRRSLSVMGQGVAAERG